MQACVWLTVWLLYLSVWATGHPPAGGRAPSSVCSELRSYGGTAAAVLPAGRRIGVARPVRTSVSVCVTARGTPDDGGARGSVSASECGRSWIVGTGRGRKGQGSKNGRGRRSHTALPSESTQNEATNTATEARSACHSIPRRVDTTK